MVINALERQGAPNIRTTGSAGIQRKAEKLKRGTFAEEAFEEIGDIVLIWSLQRYFGKPLLSHYHLEAIARGKWGKRVSSTTQTTAKAEGESSSAAPPTRVRERRERRAKFATLADFVTAAVLSRTRIQGREAVPFAAVATTIP